MEEITIDFLDIVNQCNEEMILIFKTIFNHGIGIFFVLTLILLLSILSMDILKKI